MTPPKVLGAPKPTSSVMISSTLGAPLGGTTRGGHHGFDCAALRFAVPPHDRSSGGSTSPGMVRVPAGEPMALPIDAAATGAVPAAGAGVCALAPLTSQEPPNAVAKAALAEDRNSCRRFM